MSEFKGTPGRWELLLPSDVERACSFPGVHIRSDNDGELVAFVGREEDAHLLRAAPELFAAMEGILSCPFDIDPATIPEAGITSNPEQVVAVMSISIERLRQARATVRRILGQ